MSQICSHIYSPIFYICNFCSRVALNSIFATTAYKITRVISRSTTKLIWPLYSNAKMSKTNLLLLCPVDKKLEWLLEASLFRKATSHSIWHLYVVKISLWYFVHKHVGVLKELSNCLASFDVDFVAIWIRMTLSAK